MHPQGIEPHADRIVDVHVGFRPHLHGKAAALAVGDLHQLFGPEQFHHPDTAAQGRGLVLSNQRKVLRANAQHGFAEEGNSWGGYDETTAREAWTRATAFLEDKLKR